MQDSNIPAKFPIIWASGTGANYVRQIPDTSTDPTVASLTLGFPPETATPIAAGGTPPDVRDENGILNQLCAWAQWGQAGAPITYDENFSTAIGGYPTSAVLANATTVGSFWISQIDNNTTNPDAGGTNWLGFTLVGFGTAAYKNTTNNTMPSVAAIVGTIAAGHYAVFADNNGSIKDGGAPITTGTAAQKNASDNTQSTVASVVGGTTARHFASFNDGTGTVKDSGYSAVAFDAAGAATAAQAAAQSFATAADIVVASNASADATSKANAAQSNAETYAASVASTAQSNAETYAANAVAAETARAEAAEALLAPLSSPALINNPTAPTQAPGTNNTTLATTAFVQEALVTAPIRYARFQVTMNGSFAVANFTWGNGNFPTGCLSATCSAETNDVLNPNAAGNNLSVIVYNFIGTASGGTIRVDTEQGGVVRATVWINVIGFGN